MNIEKIARECGLYDDDQEPLTEYLQQFANAILEEAKKEEADKQKPVAWVGVDADGNPNKFRLNPFGQGIPLYKKNGDL